MSTENKRELTGYPSIDKPWLKYYEETKKLLKITDIEKYVISNK